MLCCLKMVKNWPRHLVKLPIQLHDIGCAVNIRLILKLFTIKLCRHNQNLFEPNLIFASESVFRSSLIFRPIELNAHPHRSSAQYFHEGTVFRCPHPFSCVRENRHFFSPVRVRQATGACADSVC